LISTTHDRPMFVAFARPLVAADQLVPLIDEHLAFMNALEAAGTLFASGPLTDVPFEGMTIVRAATADDARAVLDQDPWVRKNLRTYTLRPWTLKEGAL
jgi:uncharacterized protein YciI